jgi:hypothetical protein
LLRKILLVYAIGESLLLPDQFLLDSLAYLQVLRCGQFPRSLQVIPRSLDHFTTDRHIEFGIGGEGVKIARQLMTPAGADSTVGRQTHRPVEGGDRPFGGEYRQRLSVLVSSDIPSPFRNRLSVESMCALSVIYVTVFLLMGRGSRLLVNKR